MKHFSFYRQIQLICPEAKIQQIRHRRKCGDKIYPHPTGQIQSEGEKKLRNLHLPHCKNLKEMKNFEKLGIHVEYVTKIYLEEISYTDAGRVQLGILPRQQMNPHFPAYINGRKSLDQPIYQHLIKEDSNRFSHRKK